MLLGFLSSGILLWLFVMLIVLLSLPCICVHLFKCLGWLFDLLVY